MIKTSQPASPSKVPHPASIACCIRCLALIREGDSCLSPCSLKISVLGFHTNETVALLTIRVLVVIYRLFVIYVVAPLGITANLRHDPCTLLSNNLHRHHHGRLAPTFGVLSFHMVARGILPATAVPLIYAAAMLVGTHWPLLITGWAYDRTGPAS